MLWIFTQPENLNKAYKNLYVLLDLNEDNNADIWRPCFEVNFVFIKVQFVLI